MKPLAILGIAIPVILTLLGMAGGTLHYLTVRITDPIAIVETEMKNLDGKLADSEEKLEQTERKIHELELELERVRGKLNQKTSG